MAYVQDGHDPSGLGMFSKAGRFTTEKYIIFQRKDEILFNKKRVMKVSSLPSLGNGHKLNEFASRTFDAIERKKQLELEKLSQKEENQPFYKQVSRDRINEVKSIKDPPKPVGYYHPVFSVLDKSPQKVWDILEVHKNELKQQDRVKDHRKNQIVPEVPIEDELYSPVPDKLHLRVQGHIDMGRTLSRGDTLLNTKGNPHEKRFEKIHLSSTWSKMRRAPQFNMHKTMGRDDNKIYQNKEFAPDYQPNFEFGKKGLGSCGPPLHKIPPRKSFHRPTLSQNECYFDYDMYKTQSSIFQNTQTPDFKNYLPREMDPNSPLPSFMQKFVNSRTQLSHLSHKMLEENHYMDGRFLSTDSQFKPAAKPKQKHDMDDSTDSIVYDS